MEDKDLVSISLASALGPLKHLFNYTVNLIPLSQPVFDLLDASEVRLKHFMMYLDDKISLEETFDMVMTAPSTSTISSLALECRHRPDPLVVSRGFIPWCLGLEHLTQLKVDCDYSVNIAILFVDMLQNLTMLESLEFGYLHLDTGTIMNIINRESEDLGPGEELLYNKISLIKSCNIKSISLRMSFDCFGKSKGSEKLNTFFNFILLSCPILERYDLSVPNKVTSFGVLDLDFTRQANLKHIKIKQENCSHYTFQPEPRKHWRNINVPIAPETLTPDRAITSPYYINLAWDTRNRNLVFHLSDCK